MLSAIFTGSYINGVLALIALILAFPPVFTKRGHVEGLLMSLSLVIFYSVRGMLSFLDASNASRVSAVKPSQLFAFTEIPTIFAAVYGGLKFLPDWLAMPYQWTLLASSPLFILMEGLCSIIIILECGERCSNILADASSFIKALVASVCFGVFGVSFYVIGEIYTSASICTIMIGLTVLTIFVEHGTITDAAMLCLYVTYNVWCITRSWKDNFMSAVQIESVFDFLLNPSRIFSLYPANNSMLSAITALASMFSVEIVVHLMIQMCVFVLAVRMIGQALKEQDASDNNDSSLDKKNKVDNSWIAYQDWIFNIIWPSFGRLLLILVYTYAWILHTRPDLVQQEWSWFNPITWRYVNVVMVLIVYLKHLLTPKDEPVLLKLD